MDYLGPDPCARPEVTKQWPKAVSQFWANVGDHGNPNACWLWQGHKWTSHRATYGKVLVRNPQKMRRDHVFAHRLAYQLFVGPIPDGMTIDHLCKNGTCVNPRHMELVTMKENILRGTSPSAMHKRQTHCKRGHPFDEENTLWYRGGRHCRICVKAYQDAYNQRRRRTV